MLRLSKFIFYILVNANLLLAQNSNEIFKKIQKFNFLGSVLYIAAHPDDENTRLISYFSNHINARTAYLSITRGDGGQNLIGSDLREKLGLIRTQELLNARKIDGGEQFFTTANDFGYSKHSDETLSVWDKKETLSQIVYRIQSFKPDIIINRFNHRTPGTTHGHHTSSAILSLEAFEILNLNTNKLDSVNSWRPKRLFYNTSWMAYKSLEDFNNSDKSNMISINTNIYDPIKGLLNSEISSLSRSQHKSQGFGSSSGLVANNEYLELIDGERLKSNNVFEGIDTSWNRLENGHEIALITNDIIRDFNFTKPYKSISKLIEVYFKLDTINNSHWREIKKRELSEIISSCLGLKVQINTSKAYGVPGESVEVNYELLNSSPYEINLEEIYLNKIKFKGSSIKSKQILKSKINIEIPNIMTTPYWLLNKSKVGNYMVYGNTNKGLPETLNPLILKFIFTINEVSFSIHRPLTYRYTDPVDGEIKENFQILPKASTKLSKRVYLFQEETEKNIEVIVTNHSSTLTGEVFINIPRGWKSIPEKQKVFINSKGRSESYFFKIIPSEKFDINDLSSTVISSEKKYNYSFTSFKYPHISKQYILSPNKSKAVNLKLQSKVNRIGYINGAGDNIPFYLKGIGIDVVNLDLSTLNLDKIKGFQSIVMGIRAYNTNLLIESKNKILWDYVKNGGNLIIQYNTSRRLKVKEITPFYLNLSRDRVTNENAIVEFINPKHPILNFPNKISNKDFEGWFQERGLYFPNNWSDEFKPILKMNDQGELSKEGSLLIADYGKGTFIYTGLSFFRQLPMGVPGAYRLFTNMISYKR